MKRWPLALLALLALLVACGAREPAVVRLMTHDSFSISEEVLEAFEGESGITVELLPSGDAGAALNQAILSQDDPLADVFFGVDNTFLSRALTAGIFEPYNSPALKAIPAALKLDPENRLLPVDYGDVCLNYDRAWFAERGLAPPASLEELTRPEYANLLVVENPATSSPGLAFLLATVGHFGEDELSELLGRSAGQRCTGDRWLGRCLLGAVHSRLGRRPAAGGQLCQQPAGRGLFCRAADCRSSHGRHRCGWHLLPPDRVRRHPHGDEKPKGSARVGGLYARHGVSGGPPVADVHVPGQPGRAITTGFCSARANPPAAGGGRPGRHRGQPRGVD